MSHQEGVKGIRKVCQLMEKCDGQEEGVLKGMWRGVTSDSMLRAYLTVTGWV